MGIAHNVGGHVRPQMTSNITQNDVICNTNYVIHGLIRPQTDATGKNPRDKNKNEG
jgi:hypothetical protein